MPGRALEELCSCSGDHTTGVPCRLQALFVALNDEAGSVRALAISAVGRLAGLNPGYILPAARKHLIQLLNDMEHSPDSRQRQGWPQQLSKDLTDDLLIWHGE